MLHKNKQIEDYDALIYGFPVLYSAKHYEGEGFNTNARYNWTGEIGVLVHYLWIHTLQAGTNFYVC